MVGDVIWTKPEKKDQQENKQRSVTGVVPGEGWVLEISLGFNGSR